MSGPPTFIHPDLSEKPWQETHVVRSTSGSFTRQPPSFCMSLPSTPLLLSCLFDKYGLSATSALVQQAILSCWQCCQRTSQSSLNSHHSHHNPVNITGSLLDHYHWGRWCVCSWQRSRSFQCLIQVRRLNGPMPRSSAQICRLQKVTIQVCQQKFFFLSKSLLLCQAWSFVRNKIYNPIKNQPLAIKYSLNCIDCP